MLILLSDIAEVDVSPIIAANTCLFSLMRRFDSLMASSYSSFRRCASDFVILFRSLVLQDSNRFKLVPSLSANRFEDFFTLNERFIKTDIVVLSVFLYSASKT